ncbi:heavy metal-associated domain-containing protein [Puteibacter caeruleilacunae]|nr:heavy metal-associated domain-containing protein [Puteibacter caeruleilacunae]
MIVEFIIKYLTELWDLTLEMAPWLIIGLVFAGVLKVYFPQKHINRFMGKSNTKSVLNASLLGIPMPLCSCGVIPTGISFYRNGASKGATNSFLISTPQTGVDSILATYSLMGWPFALIRPIVALFTGVLGGIITNRFATGQQPPKKTAPSKKVSYAFAPASPSANKVNIGNVGTFQPIQTGHKSEAVTTCKDDSCCSTATPPQEGNKIIRMLHYAFIEMLSDIAKWLVIGLMLAALIAVIIPPDFFDRYIGSGLLEIFLILAASVPLYICATGSIPIAAVLILKGVSPGAALVFLMAGPATNMATITVIGKTMGKRSLFAYLFSIIGGAVLSGILINEIFPGDWLASFITYSGDHVHSIIPHWLMLSSSVVLIGFIAYAFINELIQKYKGLKTISKDAKNELTLKVTGMTCNHCKANVERNLAAIDHVDSVMVNLAAGLVTVKGKINPSVIRTTITELGYQVIDE